MTDIRTCADDNPNLTFCGVGFALENCCPKDTRCVPYAPDEKQLSLNALVCCPNGTDCSNLIPTTCDVSQYDPTLNPGAQIQVMESGRPIELESCGDSCCPPGYRCSAQTCIVKLFDKTEEPSAVSLGVSSATATPSSRPTSTSLPISTTIGTPQPTPSSTEVPPSQPDSNDTRIIALGSTIGGLSLLITVILSFFFFRRRKMRLARSKQGGWSKAELEGSQLDTSSKPTTGRVEELDGSEEAYEMPDPETLERGIAELMPSTDSRKTVLVHELPAEDPRLYGDRGNGA